MVVKNVYCLKKYIVSLIEYIVWINFDMCCYIVFLVNIIYGRFGNVMIKLVVIRK